MKARLYILLLLTLCLNLRAQGIDQQDSLALVAVYNAAGGPAWFTSWNLNSSADGWYGVTIVNDKVTELDLSDNNLSGSIATEIGNLDMLIGLNLSENQLEGEIPAEVGLLINLEEIDLEFNQLSGEIPVEIGQLVNLIELDLEANQLSGVIPQEIGLLVNLEELDLSFNQLTGNLPVTIGQLVNLIELDVSDNQLEGVIPDEIGQLVNLVELGLSYNRFTGITDQIGQLQTLEILNLSDNLLSGSVTQSIGLLINLEELDLSHNQLDIIPPSIHQLENLLILDLSHNRLATFPETFEDAASLNSLIELSLGHNQLASFPIGLQYLNDLESLLLQNNRLKGGITFDMISGLTELKKIFLFGNEIEGLGDMSPLNKIDIFQVMDNLLTFEDLEPNMTANFDFFYSPQKNQVLSDTFQLLPGEAVSFGREIGGSTNSYKWSKGNVELNETGAFISIDSVSFEDAGVYELEITNAEVASLSFEYTAVVLIEPKTPMIISPFPYCIADDAVVLTLKEGGSAGTFWYNDATLTDLIGEGESIKIVMEGIARDTIYIVNEAGLLQKDTAVILIKSPTIIKKGDTLFVREPQAESYEWYEQGNLISGVTQNFYVLPSGSENGPFAVTVITREGCASTSALFYPNGKPLAVAEAKEGKQFTVYPNPSEGIFNIQMKDNMLLTVYHTTGKPVWKQNIHQASQLFEQTLDLSVLPDGMYILELVNDKGKTYRRIIKHQ